MLNIVTDHTQIEQVSNFKHLGLTVDSHLTFTEHCNTICKRVDQWTGLLWRIRNFIPESLALHLYKSLIHPHFLYCAHWCDGCNLGNQRHLQVSQNNALHAVLQAPPRSSTEQLHLKCNIPWLDIERAKFTCIETYKCLHELNPPNVNTLVNYYDPARSTRLGDSYSIICPPTRTKYGEINFPWRAHSYWQALPIPIRISDSLNAFKTAVKTFDGFVHIR